MALSRPREHARHARAACQARHGALSLLGGRSHRCPPGPPAFPSAPPGVGKALGPISLELPTCVLRLQVPCELPGPGSSVSLSPWRGEIVVQLCCGAAWGCPWRTCGEKERRGMEAAVSAQRPPQCRQARQSRQLLATRARRSSVPSCSLPPGHRCGPARASAIPAPALPQRSPRGRAWLAVFPPSPPPRPAASPIPHLAALVQQRQPLVGLGAGVRPLLRWHLRGPLPDTCHGHPGEMLPPDGAALPGVATPGLWPQKSPHRAGRRADPLSQWPLGTMPALVTKAWR